MSEQITKAAFWNDIATEYTDEIFSVFKMDRNKILPKYFRRYANPKGIAVDFGCGVGSGFPYLAPAFKKITAIDFSQDCLDEAAQKPYTNIEFICADLAERKFSFPKADFAFCCNVAIVPDVNKSYAILKNVVAAMGKGKPVIFVVPSYESWCISMQRLLEWNKKDGTASNRIPEEDLRKKLLTSKNLAQGLLAIDGELTKHYSCPELFTLFNTAQSEITAIERIEYEWTTEFKKPPKWMQAPYPWDWMIEVKKR